MAHLKNKQIEESLVCVEECVEKFPESYLGYQVKIVVL